MCNTCTQSTWFIDLYYFTFQVSMVDLISGTCPVKDEFALFTFSFTSPKTLPNDSVVWVTGGLTMETFINSTLKMVKIDRMYRYIYTRINVISMHEEIWLAPDSNLAKDFDHWPLHRLHFKLKYWNFGTVPTLAEIFPSVLPAITCPWSSYPKLT